MRIFIAMTVVATAAALFANPATGAYRSDGVSWQRYGNETKSTYLIGAWDGYVYTVTWKLVPSADDFAVLECAIRREYRAADLVTMVDTYYEKTKDLKTPPAEALFKEMVKLCARSEKAPRQ